MSLDVPNPSFPRASLHAMLKIDLLLKVVFFGPQMGPQVDPKMGPQRDRKWVPKWTRKGTENGYPKKGTRDSQRKRLPRNPNWKLSNSNSIIELEVELELKLVRQA